MPDLGRILGDELSIKGWVEVYSRPKSNLPGHLGNWKLEYETPNLVVSVGKNLVASMLAEQSGFDTGITYCDVGTDDTTPVVGDVDLVAGHKRNAITSYLVGGRVAQFRTFYAAADITVYLKEVGLFGHTTATSTLGTGVLFNRAIIDFDNTSGTKDLTLVIQVTFG